MKQLSMAAGRCQGPKAAAVCHHRAMVHLSGALPPAPSAKSRNPRPGARASRPPPGLLCPWWPRWLFSCPAPSGTLSPGPSSAKPFHPVFRQRNAQLRGVRQMEGSEPRPFPHRTLRAPRPGGRIHPASARKRSHNRTLDSAVFDGENARARDVPFSSLSSQPQPPPSPL